MYINKPVDPHQQAPTRMAVPHQVRVRWMGKLWVQDPQGV